MSSDPRTEVRDVRAADPELSQETNRRLTEELREAVGQERVEVPADRPRASAGAQPRRQSAGAYLSIHRFQLLRITAIVLTFGAIVALATGKWWVLPLAAGVHALGTMAVTLTIIRMTTVIEHPSPQLAAALSEEGVSSPDERFSEMVEEFRPEPDSGASEVVSAGHNERSAPASENPAAAGSQQSSSITPTAEESEPGGEGGLPDFMPWAVAIALFVVSIVFPAVMGGGWMWLLTAVMVPLLVAWVITQQVMRTRRPHVGGAFLVTVAICTVVAVAAFCAVVALAFNH